MNIRLLLKDSVSIWIKTLELHVYGKCHLHVVNYMEWYVKITYSLRETKKIPKYICKVFSIQCEFSVSYRRIRNFFCGKEHLPAGFADMLLKNVIFKTKKKTWWTKSRIEVFLKIFYDKSRSAVIKKRATVSIPYKKAALTTFLRISSRGVFWKKRKNSGCYRRFPEKKRRFSEFHWEILPLAGFLILCLLFQNAFPWVVLPFWAESKDYTSFQGLKKENFNSKFQSSVWILCSVHKRIKR